MEYRTKSTRARAAHLALLAALAGVLSPAGAGAQERAAREDDFYRIETVPVPEGIVLEVGGLTALPDGSIAASTRRGEVWIIENPTMEGGGLPHFSRFAHGLHEPLGLAYRDGAFYASQRAELTRMRDADGDREADLYETVYSWPLSGNYHEYSYGPVFNPQGNMMVTLNLAWVGRGASLAKWRGWTLEITPDGQMTPVATGMRSPAGFGYNLEGDLFYTDNQGDWVGSGHLTHVERGDFVGNPEGLRWTSEPGSPLNLKAEDVPNTGEPRHVVAQRVPGFKTPAVWFPHAVMGISTSDILVDSTGGAFGPFQGQLFVGDQGHSRIMRVFLEKVDGVYQGAVFPFREGFASGVLRQVWGKDGSMFVGMTSRGWASTGKEPFGLQRLVWTGRVPFEAQKVEARPDGFELTFTQPVDRAAAESLASYKVTGFTYRYHQTYGSAAVDQQTHPVRHAAVSSDGLRVRLVVDGLRPGYVHELDMDGVRSRAGAPLLHDVAYYTLNRVPAGERLTFAAPAATPAAAAPARPAGAAVAGRPASAAPAAKYVTALPADWGGEADVTINIGTQPGMKFDLPDFTVKPGARVRLVFNNVDDMLHNVLIVRPGRADAVVQAAMQMGLQGQDRGFVPDTDDVLFHTSLLQPESQETIYFQAPTTPGEYTYVCTFPGHGFVMRGTMRVRA